MGDPVVLVIVAGAAGVVVLVILVRLWQRWRWSLYLAHRRRESRKQQRAIDAQRQQIEQLAARIVSTSSTASIAGFEILRQIEAVFTDGHPSQTMAVAALKALAADRGANALINLRSERLPSGKCVAHGDAVIVRPTGDGTDRLPSIEPGALADDIDVESNKADS